MVKAFVSRSAIVWVGTVAEVVLKRTDAMMEMIKDEFKRCHDVQERLSVLNQKSLLSLCRKMEVAVHFAICALCACAITQVAKLAKPGSISGAGPGSNNAPRDFISSRRGTR